MCDGRIFLQKTCTGLTGGVGCLSLKKWTLRKTACCPQYHPSSMGRHAPSARSRMPAARYSFVAERVPRKAPLSDMHGAERRLRRMQRGGSAGARRSSDGVPVRARQRDTPCPQADLPPRRAPFCAASPFCFARAPSSFVLFARRQGAGQGEALPCGKSVILENPYEI